MTTLAYSDYADFNEVVDTEVIVVIRQSHFNASNVLYTLDYDKYEVELAKFLDDEAILIELIKKQFPSIISSAFEDYFSSEEDCQHKIKLIKKVWDSIIGVLYGLFIAEIFEEKIPLGKSRINPERICIGDTGLQLIIIEDLFEYILQENHKLGFLKIIDFEGFLIIKQLYSQSKDYFLNEEHDTEVSLEEIEYNLRANLLKAIKKIRKLWHLTLIKYISHEIDIFPKCQFFKGSSFYESIDNINVSKEFILTHPDFNLSTFVYANFFGKTILVSPLIHFIDNPEKIVSICLFKNSSGDEISFLTTNGKLKKTKDEACSALINQIIETISVNKTENLTLEIDKPSTNVTENFDYDIVESYIKGGKTSQALEYLTSSILNADDRRDIIMLSNRYQKLRNDMINGILSFEEENRERNRISSAMLILTEPYQKKQ
jgi:hypothetical protein